MVDIKNVQKQLKTLKFGGNAWNQAEVRELPSILHDDEKILECANGVYEGGFALLVATDMRLLLVDKKPLNYLNVEDLRFDMINEIDYSHRIFGATIIISTGSKTLRFKSYNQPRLRRLIVLVQERMSNNKQEQSKKADTQQQHLEEINKQLQMYLMAQHQQLQEQIAGRPIQPVQLPKPDPKLSDYLFAQRLLEQFQRDNASAVAALSDETEAPQAAAVQPSVSAAEPSPAPAPEISEAELVADAQQEVFGHRPIQQSSSAASAEPKQAAPLNAFSMPNPAGIFKGLEVNPLRVAYSKLPMVLRNRKFGHPSLHASTQQSSVQLSTNQAPAS